MLWRLAQCLAECAKVSMSCTLTSISCLEIPFPAQAMSALSLKKQSLNSKNSNYPPVTTSLQHLQKSRQVCSPKVITFQEAKVLCNSSRCKVSLYRFKIATRICCAKLKQFWHPSPVMLTTRMGANHSLSVTKANAKKSKMLMLTRIAKA